MSRLTQLQLKGFRCWDELMWSPEGDVHLLLGDNGVGKTSILEAVYILAQLSPPQGLRWRELIPQATDTGFVAGCLSGPSIEDDVRVGFDRQERRFRVGGKAPLSAGHHAQKHPVVFFRPGDLSLVQGGPRGRRRLLDGIATALVPEHRDLMGRYNQALAARNALLRPQARGGELLDLWSQEAARYGAQIIAHRARASDALTQEVQPAYASLCAGSEQLTARYRSSVGLDGPRDALLRLWATQLGRDRRAGHTGMGPHAEDWELRLDGRNLRQRASQGQQRSAVLACRLAQVALISSQLGPPILLLDDIAGELDDQRSTRLFERLLDGAGQVLMTGTHNPSNKSFIGRDIASYDVKRSQMTRL